MPSSENAKRSARLLARDAISFYSREEILALARLSVAELTEVAKYLKEIDARADLAF